ncbi:hypothetical protein MKI84_03675 [Ancylobacter sp. A5.8]|uniref:hypothetical protein n=1 Tax=Ancylobacter gelatini TaxID=2919920 RepID=UPI001F4D8239|nr:hypothetical protein [Ancylobacter gelatini]MCJ8142008.1 hypothetical protein [Ancylobacter gelatini]
MVTLRPAALVLAAAFGIGLGLPAVTSQPTGFVSSAQQDAPDVNAPASDPPARASSPTVPASSSQGVMQVPPPAVLLALLRGTLAAVNQANVTGNYSVLRDLGAPAFRENYNAAELADRFRPWRDNALDFAAILLLDAKLSRAPSIDKDGVLRLAGYFPTAPLRIGFDLGFQAIGGNWRLSTISVDARQQQASDAPVAKSAPAAPAPGVAATRDVPSPAPISIARETPSAAPARGLPPPAASGRNDTAPAIAPFSATASRLAVRPAPFDMRP